MGPIRDLDDAWRGTLDSISELASGDEGAPALPYPSAVGLTYTGPDHTQDDSGLPDEQAEGDTDTAPALDKENIDPTGGQDNTASPVHGGSRHTIDTLGIQGLRQLSHNNSYVRLDRLI